MSNSSLNLLNFDDSHKIKIDRKIISYKYPTYFFKTKQLLSLLKDLVQDNLLSDNSFKHYTGLDIPLHELVDSCKCDYVLMLKKINKLGKMLTESGKIKYAKISGPELRSMVDDFVDDGPELKIMMLSDWEQKIEHYLAQIKN